MTGSGGVTTTVVGSLEAQPSSIQFDPNSSSTSANPTPSSPPINPSSTHNTAAIVGGAAGGLAAIGVAGIAGFYFMRRRRRSSRSFEVNGGEIETVPSFAQFSDAAQVSPYATPNFSRTLSVETYSSPGG